MAHLERHRRAASCGALLFPCGAWNWWRPSTRLGSSCTRTDTVRDDAGTYYDDVREINALNHYIGMKPIKTVTEMKLFVPGMRGPDRWRRARLFVAWKRKWLRR